MTRDETIQSFEHQIIGMIHDAWSRNRDGRDHAVFLRRILPVLEVVLGQVYVAGYQAGVQDQENITKPGTKRELFGKSQKEKESNGE